MEYQLLMDKASRYPERELLATPLHCLCRTAGHLRALDQQACAVAVGPARELVKVSWHGYLSDLI